MVQSSASIAQGTAIYPEYQMIISNKNGDSYVVDPLDGVQLSRSFSLVPAKLVFKVPQDKVLSFTEGNTVVFNVDGTCVFKGYIFESSRTKDDSISITAYDQLRYFKNKDCYVYYEKTAADLLKMLCTDYKLTVGDVDNTIYKIPKRIEDNKTLADIMQYALDQTIINTEKHNIYVLYDDAGEICLKYIDHMKLDILIDADVMADYNYKCSIDNDTYNIVKIVREAPGDRGKALVRTGEAADEDNIKEWGRLQYLMRPDDKTINAVERAKNFLQLHDCKSREIRLRNVIGDIRVRGGSLVFVSMDFGDLKLSNYFMVLNVVHRFSESFHTMDVDIMYVEQPGSFKVTYDNDAAVLTKIQSSSSSNANTAAKVDAGVEACTGRVSPFGSEGCVDTVCYAGSYYNSDLAAEYNKGVTGTDTLCSDLEAKGYKVEPYTGTANKGDILVYDDRSHVVIADGSGGCFGNSSSAGYAMRYGNVDNAYAAGVAPSEIIRMG